MAEAVAADKPRQFPCPKCGADVEFIPRVGLKCPFCGHEAGAPTNEDQVIEEFSFSTYLSRKSRGWAAPAEAKEIACKQCGGRSEIAGDQASMRCAWCGVPMVVESKPAEDVVRPEAVIPFTIDKGQCHQMFGTWIAGLWFAPTELKRLRETDRLVGVYRPYWTYDTATDSFYRGERGEYYWVTETYWTKNGMRTRQVRKIRWYPASGRVDAFFDDVLVGGGRTLEWDTKYNLAGLKPYDAGFLAGWQAEKYTTDAEHAWPAAREQIDRQIHTLVCRDIGGDEQRVHSIRTSYNAIRFKHILLPIWLATYFYRGKPFRFQVNGQTGEVRGQRPYSFWKIFFLVLTILAVVGTVIALVAANA